MRRWRSTHPLNPVQRFEANCRAYSRVLIRRGKLQKRFACEKCGAPSPQMHHPDYCRPREIVWLCPACHKQLHDKERITLLLHAAKNAKESI